jgi:hypothetical protein
MERGPAGNTSLAAAFPMARELERDAILVVQETEYTGAGKHPLAQLALAQQLGVRVCRGDPRDSRPGESILIPEGPEQLRIEEVDLDRVRRSYLCKALAAVPADQSLGPADIEFLAADTHSNPSWVQEVMDETQKTA